MKADRFAILSSLALFAICFVLAGLAEAQTVIGPESYSNETALPLPSTAIWKIGLLPIICFIWGVVQILRMLIGQLKIDGMVFPASLGVSGGVVVLYAWLLGYSLPNNFPIWKFLALIAIAAGGTALFVYMIVRKSDFRYEWFNRLKNTSTQIRLRGIVQCCFFLFVIVFVAWLIEAKALDFTEPCDTSRCRGYELLIGDKNGGWGGLWVFTLIASSSLNVIIIGVWALWRFRKI